MFKLTRICLNAAKKDMALNTFLGCGTVSIKMINEAPRLYFGNEHFKAAIDGGTKKYYYIKLDDGCKISTNNYDGSIGANKSIYVYKGKYYADRQLQYSTRTHSKFYIMEILGAILLLFAALVVYVVLFD